MGMTFRRHRRSPAPEVVEPKPVPAPVEESPVEEPQEEKVRKPRAKGKAE
jgi:hypothetical protein